MQAKSGHRATARVDRRAPWGHHHGAQSSSRKTSRAGVAGARGARESAMDSHIASAHLRSAPRAHSEAGTRVRLRRLARVVVALALAACSDDPAGDLAAGAGGGGGGSASCTGTFCLEDDIRLEFVPAQVEFLDAPVGSVNNATVQVRHVGNRGTLVVSDLSIVQQGGEFSVVLAAGAPTSGAFTLKPGEVHSLQLRYEPLKTGAKAAQLLVESNATDAVMRHAVVPITVYAGSGALKIIPDPIDFGGVPVGPAVDKSARLYNTGSKDLVIDKLAIAEGSHPGFAIANPPALPLTIAVNASLDVVVRYTPTVDGSAVGVLAVQYDGDRFAEVDIVAETPGPKISVVPPLLNFGTLAKGEKQTRQFKIFSTGAGPLHVSALALSPLSKVKDVVVSEAGPLVLQPGEDKLVDVTLTVDTELGSASGAVASLLISSDAGNNPSVNVPLAVTGKPCVPSEATSAVEAVASGGQVDILVAIDTSGSMKDEAKAVQQNLNALSSIISNKKIDVHVILLADGFGLCVPPPLGGPNCGDSPQFRHIKVKVDSTDALEKIVSSYPLYQSFLRVGAAEHFIVVTDDKSDKDGAWFKGKLAALPPPGYPDGFTFHSIVSWSDAFAYLPCLGGAGWGGVYLDLSKTTGGETASICSANWSSVFAAIGNNVVKTVKVQCIYALPTDKDGKVVPVGELSLSWSDGGGAQKAIPRVDGPADCPPDSVGWHVDSAAAPTSAVLCPSTCEAMSGKSLHFHFGCAP
jgi:hypothetical protein